MTDAVQVARERKAHRLADVLDLASDEFDDTELGLLRFVGQEHRDLAAEYARVRPPSDETWARTIEILIRRRFMRRLLVAAIVAAQPRKEAV